MTKLSGGLNSWYVVPVKNPQRKEQEPYQAECEDIIQALGMTFDEGCAFKALWRNAAARMGNGKPGNTAVYDAEKLVHYANRILAKERIATIVAPFLEPEGSDGRRPVPNEASDVGWVYASVRPQITRPYWGIEVVYRNNYRHTHTSSNEVMWSEVLKYRINYV
jgi:hypothetical protein